MTSTEGFVIAQPVMSGKGSRRTEMHLSRQRQLCCSAPWSRLVIPCSPGCAADRQSQLWTLPVIAGCNSTALSDEKSQEIINHLTPRERKTHLPVVSLLLTSVSLAGSAGVGLNRDFGFGLCLCRVQPPQTQVWSSHEQ